MKNYWSTIRDYFLIVLASLIQAVSLRLFFVPVQLASGGVTGIAQLINHFTNWPIGLMVFIGNAPLFALGWRYLGGHRFAIRTAVAIFTYSFFTDLLPRLSFFPQHGITDDILLDCLYGAIVSGFGYGLVYRARGTSGGSDILARILNNWRSIPMTQSYMMVDTAVILAAGFIFGWKQALYALITLYVSGIVAETTLEGSGTVRTAMIVTKEAETISNRILDELQRGVTFLHGRGAYTGEQRPVLYCVVMRAEIATLKAIVNEIDPEAFMVVGVAHEALGEGFKPLKNK